MSEKTGITWCDHTFNPWWGCTRVSPGCEKCYAETFDARLGGEHWGPKSERRFFKDKHWNDPLRWDASAEKAGVRRRVFCASMADVFEDRPDLDGPRERLWKLIEQTPSLDWQLLTKRPQNVMSMVPARWNETLDGAASPAWNAWPSNAWLGVTAEDQDYADRRVPILCSIPARVRFVSYEPALGPVDFDRRVRIGPHPIAGAVIDLPWLYMVDWVIVGGESGRGARPFDVRWAKSTIEQCKAAGKACFVKQLGAAPIGADWTRDIRDGKGGDPAEWPRELRVQEFP